MHVSRCSHNTWPDTILSARLDSKFEATPPSSLDSSSKDKPRQVGRYYPIKSTSKASKWKILSYDDLPIGWVDCHKFLPADFDLVRVLTSLNQIKFAWYCGVSWDGGNLKKKDVITHWKYFSPRYLFLEEENESRITKSLPSC